MQITFRQRKLAAIALFTAATVACSLPLAAQEKYPNKPLQMYIPFGPGSATDAVARVVAEGLSRQLGQPVVPNNKPGGNGMVAIRSVQGSPSPGYNLLFLHPGVVIEQVLSKGSFDFRKDLIAVARVSESPQGMFVSNLLPVNTVKELVEYMRKNPGKVNYATGGIGSSAHLNTERFRLATGTSMVHIPYPAGRAPMVTALISGDVGLFFGEMGSMKGFVDAKRVKLLATLADRRNPIYPDAPAISESGVPELRNFSASSYFGIFVEPQTPPDRVEFLNQVINKVLVERSVHDKLLSLGYSADNIGGMSSAQFSAKLNQEFLNIQSTVRDAKIQIAN